MELIACVGCARHVRAGDESCPFCGAAITAAPRSPQGSTRGLGRAAIFLFGAAIGGTAVGCGSVTPAYGVPPEDGGVMTDGGAAMDAGFDAGLGALYGGAPIDAGEDAGGPGPAYGAPAIDGG